MQFPLLTINRHDSIPKTMRLIITTGKGGVGKTSVSAATARRTAAMGYRTLVMSTDAAHSLADSMELKLDGSITNISPNLDALEIDIINEMRTKWREIQDYISLFMESQGMESLSAEEMAIFPGMELISALMYVLDFEKNDVYDVVIMDTAPTAETLRLLSFPDISEWYIDKLYSLLKKVIAIARQTVGRIIDLPIPSKEVMNSLEDIMNRMSAVKVILEDPKKTTVRLVINPERMVISETMRAYSYLCLYNKTVECLIVNRIYPKGMETEYFEKKLVEQEKYLETIHQAFDPLKMMYAYQQPTEMIGGDKLDMLADMIYGDSDPTEVYTTESPMKFTTEDGMDTIVLKLPFAEKSQVELFKSGDDSIVVHVGSQKRTINLPMTLAKEEMIGAELKDHVLRIKFKREKDERR